MTYTLKHKVEGYTVIVFISRILGLYEEWKVGAETFVIVDRNF